jgi:hypothetical protein
MTSECNLLLNKFTGKSKRSSVYILNINNILNILILYDFSEKFAFAHFIFKIY